MIACVQVIYKQTNFTHLPFHALINASLLRTSAGVVDVGQARTKMML